jgi:hypothetical protein
MILGISGRIACAVHGTTSKGAPLLTFRTDHYILAFVGFLWLLWHREIQKRRDKLAKINKELGDNKVIAEIAARNPEMKESLRSMGVRQMVLKEYGVYCVKCKAFIRINTYEFDPPLKPAPQFFPARGAQELTCHACGNVCVYSSDADVVHRPVN